MNTDGKQQHIHVFATKYPLGASSYYLPPTRREEIDNCKDEKVRQRKYYSFKLLELALNVVYSRLMRDVKLERNASGKWTCDVCEFSISHCNDVVVVAVSDKPVGVDIEAIDFARFDERLQQRIMCGNEQALAWQMSAEERAQYANKLWTAKEAIFKRDGGDALIPNAIDTTLIGYETAIVSDGNIKYYLSTVGQTGAVVDYHVQRVTIEKI